MSNSKKLICSFLCILLFQFGQAQEKHLSSKMGETTIGIGFGLQYGAMGIRLGTNIVDELSLFGGLGYQVSGVGYNIGMLKDFASSSMTQFYLTGMYGTNSAIKVTGLPSYDKVYAGASFGIGVKINSRKTEGNYWDIGLLAPIRSSSFKEDENTVKNDPRVSGLTSPSPVLIALAYNFSL